jgi:hypothetical protein
LVVQGEDEDRSWTSLVLGRASPTERWAIDEAKQSFLCSSNDIDGNIAQSQGHTDDG